MALLAIRGATTVESDEPELIKAAATQLVQEIVSKNNIKYKDDIVMVFLTMTNDLKSYNAAAAIRIGMDWGDLPFFTSQEAYIEGTLPRCIRVLLQVDCDRHRSNLKHIYLNDAKKLRPDLVEENE